MAPRTQDTALLEEGELAQDMFFFYDGLQNQGYFTRMEEEERRRIMPHWLVHRVGEYMCLLFLTDLLRLQTP